MAHRCPCGLPAVLETFPIVDGAPFPTLYWLTCTKAIAAVGRLESAGRMDEVSELLTSDAAFRERFDRAERGYIERRDAHHRLPGAGGVGGGPSDRVKCLHAHLAHHLVSGDNPVGQWVVEQIGDVCRPPPCADVVRAAIDIGTNTVRLLVRGRADLAREQAIVRLGEGVDARRELGDEPMARTIDAVRGYVEQAQDLGAGWIRVAATSAVRDATNRAAFAAAVEDATGVALEILSGPEEGRTAYRGASHAVDGECLVLDIGGGSTELITATGQSSIDIGSVRLRERFDTADPPTPGGLAAARAFAAAELTRAVERMAPLPGALVGVAGTVTTLAALDAGLERFQADVVHGCRLTRAAVESWRDRLAAMPAAEIAAIGPVEPGRADVIGFGATILAEVMAATGHDDLTVSVHDILDGLLTFP